MPRGRAALLLALALLAGACSAEPDPVQLGGTLRLGLVNPIQLDPARVSSPAAIELFRCCLVRTVVSYPGQSAERGGTELRSDLATGPAAVSTDGLRWTYTLKPDLTYAPPFEDTPIVAGDVIRALERVARLGPAAPVAPTFDVIEGFAEARAGEAGTVAGLSAPDDSTLVIDLVAPAGHLGHLLALPAAAPIPAEAIGADDGIEVLPASGPYAVSGSDRVPPGDSPTGYRAGRWLAMDRNPSWVRRSDEIRPAYADRIEVLMGRTPMDLARLVDAADVQLQLDGVPPPEQVRKYRLDPQLEDEFHLRPGNAVHALTMDVTQPPFDDVHVRRAVALAIDKQALRDLLGGRPAGTIAGHLFPDPLLAGRLRGYAPLATTGGDVERARAELRRSRYDEDGDGFCEAPACTAAALSVPGVLSAPGAGPFEALGEQVASDLAPLGIEVAVSAGEGRGALSLGPPVTPLFPDSAALVGSLLRWMPGISDRVAACEPLQGSSRADCWAELDRTLTEEVVPVVPYLFEQNIDIVAADLVHHTMDQSTGLAAVTRLGLAGGREHD